MAHARLVFSSSARAPSSTALPPVIFCTDNPVQSLVRIALTQGWVNWPETCPENSSDDTEVLANQVSLVIIQSPQVTNLHHRFPHALFISLADLDLTSSATQADLTVPSIAQQAPLEQLLSHSESHWRKNLKVYELAKEVSTRRQRMHQLTDIGLALSSKLGIDDLLSTILQEARKLASCEAGSLYLINAERDDLMTFKLAQNDCIDVSFQQMVLPITAESVAGYVASTGDEVNLADVYNISSTAPYGFNRSFDEEMGYRTRSMFALPMRDHRETVVGVLQFMNRCDLETGESIGFDEEIAELLRAVAGQAALTIQKNTLIRDISHLFERFVQASVMTIEQRDPSTSGHSSRVADSTVCLLKMLPKSNFSRFRQLELSEEHIREVRYAALLHDFGKVGVRENVLVKANKLTDDRLEILHYRVELQKERLRRRAIEQELHLLHHSKMPIEEARKQAHQTLQQQLSILDDYYEQIKKANAPKVLADGEQEHLLEIRNYDFREVDGTLSGLINDNDLVALSIRQGSLTPEERREIQSHVVHTKRFLSALPWPPELAQVPTIAGAHHEKLNGTGYPEGLLGDDIPLASRVMTVCDIFDALTAMDRPYKKAMSAQRALEILDFEVKDGLLDADVVSVFVDSRLYTQTFK